MYVNCYMYLMYVIYVKNVVFCLFFNFFFYFFSLLLFIINIEFLAIIYLMLYLGAIMVYIYLLLCLLVQI